MNIHKVIVDRSARMASSKSCTGCVLKHQKLNTHTHTNTQLGDRYLPGR